MKGIVIKADGTIYTADLAEPSFAAMQWIVGGGIEHVRPLFLKEPYCMIVNENGLLLHLPINEIGGYLYGTPIHNNPIAGDIIILKDGLNADGEPDIIGLDANEIRKLKNTMYDIKDYIQDKKEAYYGH